MSIETTVDTMVRFVTQFDDEEKAWHYYLNGVEISVEVVTRCALPNQGGTMSMRATLIQEGK